jgi:hypothetical protein
MVVPLRECVNSLRSSVLQRVRGTATIGLAYINPGVSLVRNGSSENEGTQQNEPGFEMINHQDLPNSLAESPLPTGWEGEKYLSCLI